MKIGTRIFVLPWLFSFRKRSCSVSTNDYLFVLQIGKYSIRILYPNRTDGSMKTTSFYAQFFKKEYDKEIWHQFEFNLLWEIGFCWRPDVTHHWLIREPRFRREQEEKQKVNA